MDSSSEARIVSRLVVLLKENEDDFSEENLGHGREGSTSVTDQFAATPTTSKLAGDKILSGESKLCLTTNCLKLLNTGFTAIGDSDFNASFEALPGGITRAPLYHHMQFLYDIAQKTVSLKVLHNSQSLAGPISMAPFRSLHTLEIKKAPLHLVRGLSKLRAKLRVITCSKCLHSLQDLLEGCGGDQSSAMAWCQLYAAYLGYNAIESVDSSLRLLPVLEVLDVSHNHIRDIQNYLEYLTELTVLNLSFNQICRVPSFSISARSKLRALLMRNNFLESIEGLQELTALKELDLADNCLVHQDLLKPLKYLQQLQFLMLSGNPLSLQPHYRVITVEYLYPAAAKKMVLDGQVVTEKELTRRRVTNADIATMASGRVQANLSARGPSPLPGNVMRASEISSLDQSYDWMTPDDLEVTSMPGGSGTHTKKVARKSKPTRRPRTAEISELENSMATLEVSKEGSSVDSSANGTPVSGHHLHMRRELEAMRTQMGPDWLRSLSTAANRSHRRTTSAALAPNKEPPSAPRHSSNQSTAASMSSAVPGSDSVDSQRARLLPEKLSKMGNHDGTENRHKYSNRKTAEETRALMEDEQSDGYGKDMEEVEQGQVLDVEDRLVSLYNGESDEKVPWRGKESHQSDLDYGRECEPLIVTILGKYPASDQVLVTVTERYLLEKDLDGVILTALDLKCLQSVLRVAKDQKEVTSHGDHKEQGQLQGPRQAHTIPGPVIQIYFNYVKKDKKERTYEMEDEEAAQNLVNMLTPVLANNEALAQDKGKLKCLRCDTEFHSSEAKLKVKQKARNITPSMETTAQDLEEVNCCPACDSDLVLMIEPVHRESGREHGSTSLATPYGSAVSGRDVMFASLATSSNTSTPNKAVPRANNALKKVASTPVLENSTGTTSFKSPSTGFALSSSPKPPTDLCLPQLEKSSSPSTTAAETPARRPSHSIESESLAKPSEAPGATKGSVTRKLVRNKSMDDLKRQGVVNSGDLHPVSSRKSQLDWASSLSEVPSSDVPHTRLSKRTSVSSMESDITFLPNPSRQTSQSGSDITILESKMAASSGSVFTELPASVQDARKLVEEPSQLCDSRTGKIEGSLSLREAGSVPCIGLETISTVRTEITEERNITIASHPETPMELTPCGSLTDETVHSMVKSIYENSLSQSPKMEEEVHHMTGEKSDPLEFPCRESSASIDYVPSDLIPSTGTSMPDDRPRDTSLVHYSFEDFSKADHRLALYLNMHILDQDEEILLILRCGFVQHSEGEELPGLLLVSSTNIHVFRITATRESADEPERWLKAVHKQSLVELRCVYTGLGQHSLHLAARTEASCFTFLIRDQPRCTHFFNELTAIIQESSPDGQSPWEASSEKSKTQMHEDLKKQVLLHTEDGQGASVDEINTELQRFLLCYLKSTTAQGKHDYSSLEPVCIAITPTHVCIASVNYRWPSPQVLAEGTTVDTRGQHFSLKDRQKIANITTLDLASSHELCIHFTEEETGDESQWMVVMETENSLGNLVSSIKELWEAQFGVDLQISYHECAS